MNKKIIYPNETGISILTLTGELSLEQVAAKDVPTGIPYLIVDASDIPTDREFRGAWEADFSQPHGIGGELPLQKQEVVEAEFTQVEE